ncbi:MAG: methyltransferase type 11 [Rhodospirillaceae bacterium]|nr:methyltransferase type 11 [Rhodospirillaceae bacterium]
MWLDVSYLKTFYNTALGRLTQDSLCNKIEQLWPNTDGQSTLTIGFGAPLASIFGPNPQHLFHLMPCQQGIIHLPSKETNSALLSDENKLPFADNSLDRVILLHALEFANPPHPMLRDIWRVLDGGGKLLVIVPNRRGLWARLEHTPFGHGQPYSLRQLTKLLQESVFLPEQVTSALYMPPSTGKFLQRLARAWETIIPKYLRLFSGVIIVEAEKRVYAPTNTAIGTDTRDTGWRAHPSTVGR